ncbi:MAG: GNAT family N-acetyltransferase [Stellaceae bacterium]
MPLYKNPDFLRLPSRLAALFDRCCQQSFFSLPQWYDLMARFGVPPETEIRVYTDERPGSMVAVLLQTTVEERRHCLASLTNFYSVEHGLISAPDADLNCGLAAVLSEIRAERPRWDVLRLTELDPRDASYEALVRTLRRAGLLVECAAGSATWYETMDRRVFADYLAERPSQLRSTWRRKRRGIAAAGRLSSVFFSDASGIDAAIADYQTIYAASWKPPEAFPHFIPALIRLAAELGALRLGIYYIDGVPAAAQFWIVWRGRAVIYKLAHDRRFDALSLGTLLTMEMIERVLEQDHPGEINFGRGDDPYKQLWLPRRRERWDITAANPRTIRGLRLGVEREAAKIYHRLRGEPIMPPTAPARTGSETRPRGGRNPSPETIV